MVKAAEAVKVEVVEEEDELSSYSRTALRDKLRLVEDTMTQYSIGQEDIVRGMLLAILSRQAATWSSG